MEKDTIMMRDDPVLLNDWHPVARADALAPGTTLAVRLLGEDLVLWHDGTRPHAWRDLCVHRGAQLSRGTVQDGCLACPYHGWVYDATGACVRIPAHPEQTPPAKARATTYALRERYGLLWACLGTAAHDIPPFPEWDQGGFATAVCGPYTQIRAHGPRLIENFLDAAHFPFVHAGVLGDPQRPQLGEYSTQITEEGIVSDPIRVYQPDPYGDRAGEVTYTYHVFRPLTAHFTKHMAGATNGMVLTITPHDALDCSAYFLVATTALADSAAFEAAYAPRIAAIFEQDRAIVEGQRPELLPLDLQAELHLRSDRLAIAYRSWLRQLGLRAGTA
jgi:phenylpropionate dioxygenase-like ring-hydroxylating dioxygenase large terminal subunit